MHGSTLIFNFKIFSNHSLTQNYVNAYFFSALRLRNGLHILRIQEASTTASLSAVTKEHYSFLHRLIIFTSIIITPNRNYVNHFIRYRPCIFFRLQQILLYFQLCQEANARALHTLPKRYAVSKERSDNPLSH